MKATIAVCISLIGASILAQGEVSVSSTSGVAIINGRVVCDSKNFVEGSENMETVTRNLSIDLC
jgi:hypothetical protein